jgi:hypothetical protein
MLIRAKFGCSSTTAAVTETVCAMVDALPPSLAGVRNRALILVGFAGAFRRTELVALDVADLRWETDGVRIVVRSSKTDREGAGRLKDLPFARHLEHCPVRALRDWLELAGIDAGPVFRPLSKAGRVLPRRLTDQWVALAIKQAVTPVAQRQAARTWHRLSHGTRARHDQAVWEATFIARVVRDHAGHSLRAGFVTSAAAAGAPRRDYGSDGAHARGHRHALRAKRSRAPCERGGQTWLVALSPSWWLALGAWPPRVRPRAPASTDAARRESGEVVRGCKTTTKAARVLTRDL